MRNHNEFYIYKLLIDFMLKSIIDSIIRIIDKGIYRKKVTADTYNG